ncbi:MAG: [protein-PII] uridylyltransferase [Candidatus Brocadiales bacterium]
MPSFSLQGDRPERAQVLKRLKDYVQREKALTYKLHHEGAPGRVVATRLAKLIDAVVVSAHRYTRETAPDKEVPVAWIATGGYGRGELHPFSDVDLVLFHLDETPTPYVEYLMSTVLQLLWDTGLGVSHACRGPKDSHRVMEKDFITASALLESRHVAGDESAYKYFEKEVLLHFFSNNLFSFISDRIEEARSRHRSRGMSPFLLEPNIKEDPGGLRDAQLIFWMLRLSRLLPSQFGSLLPLLNEEELLSLQKASDHILRVRTQLHLLSERRYDILERALQETVAGALGYKENNGLPGATELMRNYFTAAGKIHFHLNTVVARFEGAGRPSEAPRGPSRRPLGPDMVAIGKNLYFSREDALNGPRKAKKMMEAFLTAQRHHLEPSQQVLKLLHEHLGLVDEEFRSDPEVAKLFLGILEGTGDVSRVLSHMRDCGLLGRYIPEFDDLVGFVHYESLHSHTVDEHSLRAIGVIDRLWQLDPQEKVQKRKFLEETGRQAILRLALLLHDIGKPRGPHHSLLGAAVIPTIAKRLSLEEGDARLLEFLVENHLEMAYLFERRDHSEETALAALAEKVGNLTNLKLLYILTYADIKASGSWFAWHDSLLWELYQKAAIILSKDAAKTVAKNQRAFREQFLDLARKRGMEEEAIRHCELVPPRYAIEVEPQEAIVHLGLIQELKKDNRPIALNFSKEATFIEVWLSTEDQPARFSQISGVLAARGLNIISAQAYTRKDGIILDRFRVVPVGKQHLTDKFRREVSEDFLSVFRGKRSLIEMLSSRQRRVVPGRRPPNAGKGSTRVYIDNKSSPEYTIVDVVSPDRVGLLYTISRCLANCGLDIHFAKVTTKLDQAIDVFYVTEKERRTKVLGEEKITQIKQALIEACTDANLYEVKNKQSISG